VCVCVRMSVRARVRRDDSMVADNKKCPNKLKQQSIWPM